MPKDKMRVGILGCGSIGGFLARGVLAERQRVLAAAYAAHPERFVKGPPTPSALPREVWINRPQPVLESLGVAHSTFV